MRQLTTRPDPARTAEAESSTCILTRAGRASTPESPPYHAPDTLLPAAVDCCAAADRTALQATAAGTTTCDGANKLLLSTPTCRSPERARRRSRPHPGSNRPSFRPATSRTRSRSARPSRSAAHTHTTVRRRPCTTEAGSHHQHPRRNPRCQSCTQPGTASEGPVRPRRETRARELALGPCSTARFLHPAGTAGGSTHSPPRLAPGNWLQPPSCRLPPPPITDKRVLPTLTLPSDMAAIDASPLSDENSGIASEVRRPQAARFVHPPPQR